MAYELSILTIVFNILRMLIVIVVDIRQKKNFHKLQTQTSSSKGTTFYQQLTQELMTSIEIPLGKKSRNIDSKGITT